MRACTHLSMHARGGMQVAELAKGAGAMKTAEVAVSGGFHTPLMQPARDALVKVAAALNSMTILQLAAHEDKLHLCDGNCLQLFHARQYLACSHVSAMTAPALYLSGIMTSCDTYVLHPSAVLSIRQHARVPNRCWPAWRCVSRACRSTPMSLARPSAPRPTSPACWRGSWWSLCAGRAPS